jgi:pyruvate formate lyase activating enzyme
MIPDANDSLDEVRQMSEWIVEYLGPEVPIHFTAFHPDFRMRDRPGTPLKTLMAAYDIAKRVGIQYVYLGNIRDIDRQSTSCSVCKRLIIQREGYVVGEYRIKNGCCSYCHAKIPGYFDDHPGSWGSRRLGVDMTVWSS